MVPMGGGSSGLVKLLSGWVGRTQAVGMVRPLPPWASSTAAVAAPGTGPIEGRCSPGGAEEPGRRGAVCCVGGCCWRRGLEEASVDKAKNGEADKRMIQKKKKIQCEVKKRWEILARGIWEKRQNILLAIYEEQKNGQRKDRLITTSLSNTVINSGKRSCWILIVFFGTTRQVQSSNCPLSFKKQTSLHSSSNKYHNGPEGTCKFGP